MRWLKYVFVGIAAFIALVLIAGVIFLVTFDPEDFKERAEVAVLESTGRVLAINGPLDVSLFPWIAVKLSDVRLGNAPGFSEASFAEVDEASLGVKLMPLLSRNIEIGEVSIDGLRLRLETDANGNNNWDDLSGSDETGAEDADESSSESSFATSGIAGLDISNANLSYANAATPANYDVSNLNVKTGALTPGEPVSLSMNADISDGEINAVLSFSGTLASDESFSNIELTDMTLASTLAGYNPDGSDLDASIRSDRLRIDMDAQQLDGSDLVIALGDASLTARLSASEIIDAPKVSGSVTLAPIVINDLMSALGQAPVELPDPDAKGNLAAEFSFNTDLNTITLANLVASLDDYRVNAPGVSLSLDSQRLKVDSLQISTGDIVIDSSFSGRDVIDAPKLTGSLVLRPVAVSALMDLAGQPAIDTTDSSVLNTISLESKFKSDSNSIELNDLTVQLDESRLTGKLAVTDFETSATRFDLNIDKIDIDRYLPPADESDAGEQSTSGADDDSLDELAALDVNGTLRIAQAKAMNLNFSNLSFTLVAKDGKIRIHPSQAKMYGGNYSGDVRLDVDRSPARASLNENVTGVDINALASDLFEGGMPVTGTAKALLQIAVPYGVDGALTKDASGKIEMAVKDGVYSGVDLWYTLKSGVARVRKEQVPPAPQDPKTAFSEFIAKGPIENGRWNTEEFRVRLDYGTVTGSGYTDLNDNSLNYLLDVVIDDTPEIRQDPQLRKLVRASIPIRVTGTIDSPSAVPDVAELLRRQAQREVQEKVDEEADKLKKKLEDKLKSLFDN